MKLIQAISIERFLNYIEGEVVRARVDSDIYTTNDGWKEKVIKANDTYDVNFNSVEPTNLFIIISDGGDKPIIIRNSGEAIGELVVKKSEYQKELGDIYESNEGFMYYIPGCKEDKVTITGVNNEFTDLNNDSLSTIHELWFDHAVVVDGKTIKIVNKEKSADELKKRAAQLLGL